ncbi:MAG: biotin--[acetyl-CoA-carboxylase] ligase [Deltaproteobacteria bacterium]|nr:biotin--[acetyl-CoA-carboxylase] ligase [Deltaproteobacteria bacterium]
MKVGSWEFIELVQVDSTTSFLKREIMAGKLDLAAVTAGSQTAGRGRLSRKWLSPPGGLYMTVSVSPNDPSKVPVIAHVACAGLAMADALAHVAGIEARLKWPNDLLVKDRKLGGILSEMVSGPRGPRLLIGIGINIESAPSLENAAYQSTSIAREAGTPLPLARDLAKNFLFKLHAWLDLMKKNGYVVIAEHWKALSATIGRNVTVIAGNEKIEGRAMDLTKEFELVVETGQGKVNVGVGDCLHMNHQRRCR